MRQSWMSTPRPDLATAAMRAGLRELAGPELQRSGGSLAGDSELGRDLGRVFGAFAGAFVLMGASFYQNGGLTGGNRRLKKGRN